MIPLHMIWKEKKAIYPTLYSIVRNVFSVVSSSVEIERTFSGAKLLITDNRSKLGWERIEQCVLLREWAKSGLHHRRKLLLHLHLPLELLGTSTDLLTNFKLKEQELKMMELMNNQMQILKELSFQPHRVPFPEESKFDGTNRAEFDKNWDLFEFLFRHHFVKPTSANLLSSLRGSAIDRLRTIDPLNTKSVEENIMALRTYYQDSPSIILDRFSTYSRKQIQVT
ncbi:hypothetical protein DICPUDRAFT_82554 [Dictyostelium purpureum]|uniref:HAT C-terminal dimerisation domain-containing protein n=1 Tax=Dictyostelium purpureum TaxID=5786 RepID=F0ZWV7_DICPU|nr:uncharacterized protein DICPUDRAFT_82554 [Dictyostelium purpureum]EGC31565.1 hypothetical protein DICPUDRAFT_82554 [Dictyostelium purpureum]|eukprot:XP_003291907.1 hypothetical protein DICPUDRAFT_82554 [Dictyostelium purpureum]